MADFCNQCAREMAFEHSDSNGLCKPGYIVTFLCEGCGPTHVDDKGDCIYHEGRTSRECCEAGLRGGDIRWMGTPKENP